MLVSAATTADWIGAGAAVATVVAAVVGFWFAVRQLGVSARANVSSSYAEVSGGMSKVSDVFLEHPGWLKYFYDDTVPTANVKRRRKAEFELVCERILDFADGLVEQRRAVPEADMDWSTWECYFRFLYQQKSSLLRDYLRENLGFYPDYVLGVFGLVVVRDERTGKLSSLWEASGGGGEMCYPWFGTWTMTRLEPKEATLVVKVKPQRPGVAKVTFTWKKGQDAQAQPVLLSWVVGVLQSSSVIRVAYVFSENGLVGKVRLTRGMRLPRRRRRERFLVPEKRLRRPALPH